MKAKRVAKKQQRVTMKIFMIVGMIMMSAMADAQTIRIIGPDSRQPDLRWQVVNDTVMGGQSSSRFERNGAEVRFSGFLNTDGGGFASLRSERLNADLAPVTLIRLRVKGDGRRYSVRLYAQGERLSYQHSFSTVADEWRLLELNIRDFYATWRGRRFDRPPLAAEEIIGVGLILADGLDGPFEIALDRLEFDTALAQQASIQPR